LDHRISAARFLHGIPVMLPESARDAVVVIGIHNREADVASITQKLVGYSVKRVISPVEAYAFLGDLLGMRYWLTNPAFYENCKPVIEKAYLLLADDVSRNLYRSILEFRLTGDYKILPAPDLAHQYFPQDIPAWKEPLRLVDCGAFDGDTLSGFASNNIEIEGVAAFEPDLVNFMKLSQYISSLKNKISEAILFPCGVYSSTQQMTFEMNCGEASGISNKGGAVVQCVALDDVIPTFAPNLIKMDIEGAEYDALLGARRLIETNTPGLAISLYHRPEHLWQLPMLAGSIAPGKYKFYMRSHAMNDFDLVLYAIPMEQKK
jgi:FkbM family methyltransferase